MGVGKYSPTVSSSYARDQDWWKRHNTDPNSFGDDEGYDSYGYSENGDGADRAGYTELEYATGEDDGNGGWHYPLYERIEAEWHGRLLGDLAETAKSS